MIDGRPWLHPGYGLGIMIDESDQWKAYGHGGQGLNSSIAIFHFRGSKPRTIGVFHESENYNLLEDHVINLTSIPEVKLREKIVNRKIIFGFL